MAKPPRSSDLVTVLRGLARVGSASVEVRSQDMTRAWATSSLRPAVVEGATRLQETLNSVIQQPQAIQRNASKGAGEALARLSMVTEGLRAYQGSSSSSSSSVQPASEFPETLNREEEALYDPSIEELNIEELLMQETSSEPALASLDTTSHDGLRRVQEEATNIVDKAKTTREEFTKRVEEFEPLLNIAKGEEREITKENLDILDQKVSELEGISYGQSFLTKEETDRDLNTSTVTSDHVTVSSGHSDGVNASASTNVQELSIDNLMMHQATSSINSYPGHLLSDTQRQLYSEVQTTTESVKEKVGEMESEIKQRVLEFEPLLDMNKVERHEVNEEDLKVISEKLSDLQDVAFGHNLKIFREVENPRPVEEVLHDIASDSPASPKEMGKTQKPDVCKTEGGSDLKDPFGSTSESANRSKEATVLREDSTSQVDKCAAVNGSYSSTTSEVKVEVPLGASVEAPEVDRIISSDTDAGAMSSPSVVSQRLSPGVLDGTTGAGDATAAAAAAAPPPPPPVSSTEVAGLAAASSTLVASAAAAAAAVKGAPVPPTQPVTKPDTDSVVIKPKPKLLGKKPLAKGKPKSSLAENAQARKVPHSRIGRLVSFGGLAAGLSLGTLAEVTRRSLGLRHKEGEGSLLDSSPFLTEANARRIVDTLCRVRGAALKLGQMLSIQDSALINPQLQKIFERVRQSADFMPTWQLEEVIKHQLGDEWRSRVATFDDTPFAAASIGQVHLATLHDGRSVAMKIQYPGVAEGIESDINNLVSTLKVANIFPEGLFVDSVIEVAKKELRWECDYVREADCTRRFKALMKPYPEIYVPEVIPDLCTSQIITTELIAGIAVDKCTEIDQESRNYISEKVLRVCLLELFQFGFMQTDPNWSNFFYDAETEQLALLDFGACREYRKDFVDNYLHLIHGAAMKDRDKVLKYSQELGFLTGYEAKVMVDAHIDAIMILGEAFQEDKPFNFGDQNTTHRIQTLVPVMISHRMCAPPEEIYSLHRKMSGVFLLCAKLRAVVNCHTLFHEIFNNYEFGGTWEDFHAGQL